MSTEEAGRAWDVSARVDKFTDEQVERARLLAGLSHSDPVTHEILTAAGEDPVETVVEPQNALLTAGANRILSLLVGVGGQTLTNAYARLGVGDGTTAVAVGDTDLSAAAGATHRYFQAADPSYPTVSGNVLTMKSTFSTSNANFAWNEWGIDFGGAGTGASGTTVGAPLLNRRVPASTMGTKASGAWALTVTITLT